MRCKNINNDFGNPRDFIIGNLYNVEIELRTHPFIYFVTDEYENLICCEENCFNNNFILVNDFKFGRNINK